MGPDEQAIVAALSAYGAALNQSDTEAAMRLYAADGVFMPQGSASSVGIEAIRAAYQAIFATITLKVTFEIAEVRQLAPDWVMARTNSAGTVTVHATAARSAEANQELFLFQRLGSDWKIARYCFSTTNPPL
jgi:uncharacterized protein (TIGR02246 family)